MNSPPLIPIRRWIFHTDRLIPTSCIAARQARTCWYTLSISVPSRSNRNAGLLRASNSTAASSLNYRTRVITAESFAARLADLDDVGVGPEGVHRLAWTDEDAATRAWFERQAADAGLSVERDPAGNLWARPDADPPWWGIGSHLDSVRGGGRFDGPLGVACAFEIAAGLAGDGAPPVAVLSFADEEGARFNTPTFGSKALSGRLDLPAVLSRGDDGGVVLGDAMRAAGVDPDGIGDAPGWLRRLAGFIEIHIDQTTDLAGAGSPVGVGQRARRPDPSPDRAAGPGRSRRNDAPVRAPRRAGRGRPADRRRRGPGR